MIDKNKQYKTRNGLPVRIYATDGGGEYPVHGAVLMHGVWSLEGWTISGSVVIGNESPCDLIEVKPRIQRTAWVNVYRNGVSGAHKTRESADQYASPNRIACIKIQIDCEEGEGL